MFTKLQAAFVLESHIRLDSLGLSDLALINYFYHSLLNLLNPAALTAPNVISTLSDYLKAAQRFEPVPGEHDEHKPSLIQAQISKEL